MGSTTTPPLAVSVLNDPPTRRVWSFSAAADYPDCPRRWSYRRGPHQIRLRDTTTPLFKRRGTVVHAGVGGAYKAAREELTSAKVRQSLPADVTMHRYRDHALAAMEIEWRNLGGPPNAQLAHEVTGTLVELLDVLPVPRYGDIVEVEKGHTLVTSDGVPFRIVPDLVLRIGDRRLLLRDWKYGSIEDYPDLTGNRQLHLYVAGLAALYPDTRAFTIELFSMTRKVARTDAALPGNVAGAVAWLERIVARAEADEDPQPNPGQRCLSCAFRKLCPGPEQHWG